MKRVRKIFIASSREQIAVAKNIQSYINRNNHDYLKFNSIIWDEDGIFEKGEFALSSLTDSIRSMNFAVIILTPDDELSNNPKGKKFVPRDNLLFELGLCIGILGKEKVLVLKDSRLKEAEVLSDYVGITWIPYDYEDVSTNSGTLTAAVTSILKNFIKREDMDLQNGGYFKNKMIAWRTKREIDKFDEIKNGNWTIYALNENQYKRYVFQGVLSVLDEGDKYLTVSNLSFWSAEGFDVDKFIESNIASIERGVEIERIILLDGKIFTDYSENSAFEFSFQLLEKLIEKFEKTNLDNPDLFSKMKLRFLICDDYKKVIGVDPIPYAIIENNTFNDYALITPDYDHLITKKIYIQFQNFAKKENNPNNYKELKSKFERLISNSSTKDMITIREEINKYKNVNN